MTKLDKWNEVKKDTESKKFFLTTKPREIYWVKIGQNIGSEEFGKSDIFSRPVIIIRRLTSDLFVGIPTTSSIKDNDYFLPFEYKSKNKIVQSSAMLLQIRTFSIKRITDKIGKMSIDDFKILEERLVRMLFPPK